MQDTQAKNAKPRAKQYKITDERGLFIIIRPNGNKWWRFRYQFDGKSKEISLGVYPDVGLKAARIKRDVYRELVADGIDPSAKRQAEKLAESDTFEAVGREWLLKKKKPAVVAESYQRIETRLKQDIFPYIGKLPINDISAKQVLTALRRIEKRGAIDTAHRISSYCDHIFRYAVATNRVDNSPVRDLKGALSATKTENFAAITEPSEISELLKTIDSYKGTFITRIALQISPHVFLRPGELRKGEWSEIDFDNSTWTLPAERMKKPRAHIVPLSRQAQSLLEEIHNLTGDGRYIFPSARTPGKSTAQRPMSENAILSALRRMGYPKEVMTGHGFRTLASTNLHEMNFDSDAVEMQLAHIIPGVRGIYNKAKYLDKRKDMMQSWSDYLDGLKSGGEVIAIGKRHG